MRKNNDPAPRTGTNHQHLVESDKIIAMRFEIEVDKDNQLRITTIAGKLTFDYLKSKLEEIYGDPELVDLSNSLWDMRKADVSSFTSSDINQLSKIIADNWGKDSKNKTAIVAEKSFVFGIARMLQMELEFKSPVKLMIFHDYDDALAWLKDGTLSPSSTYETVVG